ncbi:ABC-type Fe3+ transport system [Cordyceps fumosorosea ARSEF 2679]|uniref:ABC-type Fe3+ transport system n=1 Tax=Cordyceps fumosorosea (strain ARSEF 2679) TaxID=1081104 RepID=A0A162M220_CORFA|nr:ABC-type Fe3+ transport system [Cordyceps fumosorosea ARSEF 2679]OAA49230.1 ABC-type Fe3+ transport system [Cordyceps fumosorosea ARSEF 2679]
MPYATKTRRSKMLPISLAVATLASFALGDPLFRRAPTVETRTLDEIYQAAKKEGNTVTVWHGGDEKNQQDFLKQEFEKKFPDMTLNITVDLSKYHDVRLDEQLAAKNVFVDSIILQTLNDYPRWAKEEALLSYAPAGFDKVVPEFKDADAFWYGVYVFFWSNGFNSKKLGGAAAPAEYPDWLKPEFKKNLVLTYPHDDDAVLFAFDLIIKDFGEEWFDKLLAQEPRWVRGTATPATIAGSDAHPEAAFFATGGGFGSDGALNFSQPTKGQYVSWPQRAAILKDAPHPEGAKLLHNFILSEEYQKAMGTWSVLKGFPTPAGFPDLEGNKNTDPNAFAKFMEDRGAVERRRFWYEAKMGPAVGKNPRDDDIGGPSGADAAAPAQNNTKACRPKSAKRAML